MKHKHGYKSFSSFGIHMAYILRNKNLPVIAKESSSSLLATALPRPS